MKKLTRIVAAGLAIVMAAPVFAACKRNGGANKISSDDPWYNVSTLTVGTELDSTEYEYGSLSFVSTFGDDYVFRLSGSLTMPDDFDYETDSYIDYRVDELRVYDGTGSFVRSIDLMDFIRSFNEADNVYINNVNPSSEGVEITVNGYDFERDESVSGTANVDVESGSIGSFIPTAEESAEYASRIVAQGGSDEGFMSCGEYRIRKYWLSNDRSSSYILVVVAPDGSYTEFDMRAIAPMLDIWNISGAIDIGSNRVLLPLSCAGAGDQYALLDLNSMTLTIDTSDLTWLTSKSMYISEVAGLGFIVSDVDGIYTINYDNGCLDPLFLYSYSNVNMYDLRNARPVEVSEDRAVFSGTPYNPGGSFGAVLESVIYTFTRADSNPNAGKSILRVASTGEFTYPLCAAIASFNENNGSYFIEVEQKYNVNVQADAQQNQPVNGQQSDSTQTDDNATTTLGNQLAIDIMNGTGPDIIVNGERFGMLNDPDYLLNLRSFVTDNFGSSDYLTNVFDAASDGDELYQIPVSFCVQGIVTDSSNVDAGQIGFTYDQYAEFVNGPCNGSGPIGNGRLAFFISSLNCMSDLVISDDTVEYDAPAFRALAEFTAANINEALVSDDPDAPYIPDGDRVARVVNVDGIAAFFDTVKNGNMVLLGMPSYDGRGPILYGSDSVAISAQTTAPDACREFVSLLLSDDIQVLYGQSTGIPVNRTAFEIAGQKNVDNRNRQREYLLSFLTPEDFRMEGYNAEAMDYSVVDEFESFCEGLYGWYTNDGSINAIIREEMPAYFEGQKTLDQVIPVLEDRIQTLLNERG